MATLKSLKNRLAWAMQQCGGINSGALAFITGIDKGVLSRIYTGKTTSPRPDSIKDVAAALGQDAGWLWMNVGEPREYSGLPQFPEGRSRHGDAYREAFRTLWKKDHIPIPEALGVEFRFHEREEVRAEHIVQAVRAALGERGGEYEPSEFD